MVIKTDSRKENDAKRISDLLRTVASDTEIVFEPGEYYLTEPIIISGKENWTIYAQGCTFLTYFDVRSGGKVPIKNADAFHISNCKNLKISGGTIQTHVPTHVKGQIVDVTDEYLEIKLNPKVPLKGDEEFVHGTCFDENNRPIYRCTIETDIQKDENYPEYEKERIAIAKYKICTNYPYPGMKYEIVGENLYRFYNYLEDPAYKKGMSCSLAHTYYGAAAFAFQNCHDVIMENITFPNFGGMGVIIFPRSSNFTFRNIIMENPDKEYGCDSLQADGFHFTGVGGKVLFENCRFNYLIDDPVNIHAQMLTVSQVNGNRIDVFFNKIKGTVYENWACEGDVVRVYDSVTNQFKGTVIVSSYSNDIIEAASISCELKEGDYLINDACFSQVTIDHCEVINCRGGFKLRAVDGAVIKNCKYNGNGSGVHLSIAYKTLEGGPVRNVVVENNHFIGSNREQSIFAGIYRSSDTYTKNLHQNIVIRNNIFEDSTSQKQIIVTGTNMVTITGNVMKNCTNPIIEVHSSNDVTVTGNVVC